MEIRPQSAPPRPHPAQTLLTSQSLATELEHRPKSSIGTGNRSKSVDLIEEAATASLFSRVRAFISPSDDGSDVTSAQELFDENLRSKTPAAATSSYYGDEGESGDSGSFGFGEKLSPVLRDIGGDPEAEYDINDYQSSNTDLDSVVRIGNVPQKTVAGSIVREYSPTLRRPHFTHASIPADIGRVGQSRRAGGRMLGKITPSSGASGAGTTGSMAEGSSSPEDEGNEESAIGGIDPEVIRQGVTSRPVAEPIKARDPIFRVVYDDSSSSASHRYSPDLFYRPLHVGSPVKRDPDTPINTIATPPPLIGIISATDDSNFSSLDSPISVEATGNIAFNEEAQPGGEHSLQSQSMVGHTGASTPENAILGTATVMRGTMTEFDYDEYPEEEYGPLGVPMLPFGTGTYIPPGNTANKDSEGTTQRPTKYSTEGFEGLSSYDDSEPQQPQQPHSPITLHQAYRLGESRRTGECIQIGSRSVSRAQVRDEGDTEAIIATQANSFTRIITDLEEMLNQALEIAGRAVQGSSSALDQRDASIRSFQGSIRGSLNSSAFEGTDRAVTAPESLSDPDEDTKADGRALEEEDEALEYPEPLKRPEPPERPRPPEHPELPERSERPEPWKLPEPPRIAQPAELPPTPPKHQHNYEVDSLTAVYSDNGELTNTSQKGKAKSTPQRSPLPLINPAESEREREWHRNWQDVSSDRVSTAATKSCSAKPPIPSAPEQRFRMEVGRDGEIILVRIPENLSLQPGPRGSVLPSDGDTSQERRYKGGWEWSLWGKRFAAGIACGIVGLIGWIIGSYHAVLPTIQEHLEISPRVATLGNSMLFLGLFIPTLILWPLPLLHGRKPYLLISISLLLPLQLPQALSLPPYTLDPSSWDRSMQPYVACLFIFRCISGVLLGFAFMNSFATILDLFGPDTGACCRGGVIYNNRVPLEGQDQYNTVSGGEAGVRIGVWVGIFTWIFVASPAIGYLFGKITIVRTTAAWGFWTIAILAGFLLVLVIMVPEVRPPWKKIQLTQRPRRRGPHPTTAAGPEVLERGELKLVMFGSSPEWWWEEVSAGMLLTWKMLQQRGFLVLAVYFGWVFGHLVLTIMLLTSLISSQYNFPPIGSGLATLAITLGALLVVPTQLTMFYLTNFRHRSSVTMHNSNYGHENVGQHPYRRALWIGVVILPVSSIALTISALGPPVHFAVPVFFAAIVSFSGTLTIAECYLILMDNFDISDLPEPMLTSGSGSISQGANSMNHPHGALQPISLHPPGDGSFTTAHPCLSSGLAIFHGFAFLFAAMAVGVSTHMVEGGGLGVRNGLGVYTAVTCTLTFGLGYALWRSKEVRLVEVFNQDEHERNAKVSLLQQSWGTRWTEVNGMEWWEDEHRV